MSMTREECVAELRRMLEEEPIDNPNVLTTAIAFIEVDGAALKEIAGLDATRAATNCCAARAVAIAQVREGKG